MHICMEYACLGNPVKTFSGGRAVKLKASMVPGTMKLGNPVKSFAGCCAVKLEAPMVPGTMKLLLSTEL